MRILVTRPQPDADNTARLLRESGHEVIIAPLLEIVATDIPESFDLTGIQAVLITSANGVRALAAATSERTIRVLAVGAASAEAARALGFVLVENAGWDVASLAELVRATLEPAAGRLLHVAGSVTAGDLSGILTKSGYQVEKTALYRAHTPETLPETIKTALKSHEIDAVALFSPRSAEVFQELVMQAGLRGKLQKVTAYCLSQAVADALKPSLLANVHVSYTPDQQGILDIITQHT